VHTVGHMMVLVMTMVVIVIVLVGGVNLRRVSPAVPLWTPNTVKASWLDTNLAASWQQASLLEIAMPEAAAASSRDAEDPFSYIPSLRIPLRIRSPIVAFIARPALCASEDVGSIPPNDWRPRVIGLRTSLPPLVGHWDAPVQCPPCEHVLAISIARVRTDTAEPRGSQEGHVATEAHIARTAVQGFG